jgi:peptidoglycan/xylan/chitin deacetylase (PgdA/CDA1 family)
MKATIFLIAILIFLGCNKETFTPKSVIITIDDAPNNPVNTIKILDVLKKHDVQATFFCIGRDLKLYPEIANRISKEQIMSNHTYDHLNIETELLGKMWRYNDSVIYTSTTINNVIEDELNNTQFIIDSINESNGILTNRYFRAPYGSLKQYNEEVINQTYSTIWWNYDASDWNPEITLESIIQYHKKSLESNTIDKPILLFHLTDNSVLGLDSILTYLEQKHIKVINL